MSGAAQRWVARGLRGAGRAGVACGLFLCLAASAWAQQVRFEAEVDRHSLRADELLYLTVSLNVIGSAQTGEPELDRSTDFDLMGAPERQDGYQLSGSQIARYSQRVYVLRPTRSGSLTVPAARVTVGGRQYSTEAIRVQVGRGATATAPSARGAAGPAPATAAQGKPFEGTPTFVVRCRCDRQQVAVNQQLTVTLDYYSAYRLQRAPGQAGPRAGGFVSEDLPDPDPEDVTINGREYAHYSNVWALFPATAGNLVVRAPTEKLMLPPDYREQEFRSNSVRVKVRAVPTVAGRAPAVGKFTVALSADKARVRVGESLLARVVVDGTGNLRAVPSPVLRTDPPCRIWEGARKRQPEARVVAGKPLAGGQVVFEYVVMPQQAGALTLGPVQLSTYDPAHGTTGTVRSAPVKVQVLAGAQGQTAATQPATPPSAQAGGAGERTLAVPLWLIATVAGLMAGGAVLWWLWQAQRRRRAGEQARQSGAARAARAKLRRARNAPPGEREAMVAEALSQYVADRCALPGPTALPAEVASALEGWGADEALAGEVARVIAAGREARYAPRPAGVAGADDLVRAAEGLIGRCEQALQDTAPAG